MGSPTRHVCTRSLWTIVATIPPRRGISSVIGARPGAPDAYGEHREFIVSFEDETKVALLKDFLALLARNLAEDCIYLRVGDEASLIYPIEEL